MYPWTISSASPPTPSKISNSHRVRWLFFGIYQPCLPLMRVAKRIGQTIAGGDCSANQWLAVKPDGGRERLPLSHETSFVTAPLTRGAKGGCAAQSPPLWGGCPRRGRERCLFRQNPGLVPGFCHLPQRGRHWRLRRWGVEDAAPYEFLVIVPPFPRSLRGHAVPVAIPRIKVQARAPSDEGAASEAD